MYGRRLRQSCEKVTALREVIAYSLYELETREYIALQPLDLEAASRSTRYYRYEQQEHIREGDGGVRYIKSVLL